MPELTQLRSGSRERSRIGPQITQPTCGSSVRCFQLADDDRALKDLREKVPFMEWKDREVRQGESDRTAQMCKKKEFLQIACDHTDQKWKHAAVRQHASDHTAAR